MFITLLRKADFVCCPVLGSELVFQLESAGGNRAFRRGKQGVSRPKVDGTHLFVICFKQEKSLKPQAELFSYELSSFRNPFLRIVRSLQ